MPRQPRSEYLCLRCGCALTWAVRKGAPGGGWRHVTNQWGKTCRQLPRPIRRADYEAEIALTVAGLRTRLDE